jgi:2-succinyl-5-enolpyruvyl-6-hydroxy-3-cyclohexene-1-carboxylate synthase
VAAGTGVNAAPNPAYAFTRAFFEELARAGVEHVCVSPGSRSTPLAATLAGCSELRCWSLLDERCAGFFALGLAKAAGRPVALVCTSGTAAANYLPAVVEAHYARVPLLLLTADRPPELREWGAGQTIDQLKLYGSHVRHFVELPVPAAGAGMLRYARSLACRAVAESLGEPPGPVHLNWPLREPLEPVSSAGRDAEEWAEGDLLAAEGRSGTAYVEVCQGRRTPDPGQVEALRDLALACPRGVIACGPDYGRGFGEEREGGRAELAEAVMGLARAAGWPVLADPTSQLRSGPHAARSPLLANADLLLRSEGFAAAHVPQLVLRLGGTPVSKSFRQWIERHRPAHLLLLDPDGGWDEPSTLASQLLRVDPARLCAQLATSLASELGSARSSDWLSSFVGADARTGRAIESAISNEERLFEPRAVRELCQLLPAGCLLYVGNSMPIRDLDSFMPVDTRPLRVLSNRGANGIDGMISSALGAAAARRGPVVLLTGDLTFLHDLGGLLVARRHQLDATIVVLNNDGGGIFSLLPVADYGEQVAFESLFRAPHGLDLGLAAELFGARFARVRGFDDLRSAIERSLTSSGVSIIEVPIDRDANLEHLRSLTAVATAAVADGLANERAGP